MRNKIMPNDIVMHKPSGETWSVAGVCHEDGTLVPKGYPFPSVAKCSDCELIEQNYEAHYQTEETIKALMDHGMNRYVDVRSAILHGLL